MKKLFVALAFVPLFALASPQPVAFDFSGVSLMAFAQATFKGVMKRDYVIAPEVLCR